MLLLVSMVLVLSFLVLVCCKVFGVMMVFVLFLVLLMLLVLVVIVYILGRLFSVMVSVSRNLVL